MQSGENFTSADPPSLYLPSKSLTSAATCRDRGFGEYFGLLLRSWRCKKESIVWMQSAAHFCAVLDEVSARKRQTSFGCSLGKILLVRTPPPYTCHLNPLLQLQRVGTEGLGNILGYFEELAMQKGKHRLDAVSGTFLCCFG
jgi:hypothetical protein